MRWLAAWLASLLLAAPAAAAEPGPQPAVAEGAVTAVHPLEHRFEIRTDDGESARFRLAPATIVREGERRIHDQLLEPGARVRVHASPDGVASLVEIVRRGQDPGEAAGSRAAEISVAEAPWGRVLVDRSGRALYAFSLDRTGEGAQGDAASRCVDRCAERWPPLLTNGPPLAQGGASAERLGRFERAPGVHQVSYDGWPLYRFAADEPFAAGRAGTVYGVGTARGQAGSQFGGFFRAVPPEGLPDRLDPQDSSREP